MTFKHDVGEDVARPAVWVLWGEVEHKGKGYTFYYEFDERGGEVNYFFDEDELSADFNYDEFTAYCQRKVEYSRTAWQPSRVKVAA